jgi:hypothetical protein
MKLTVTPATGHEPAVTVTLKTSPSTTVVGIDKESTTLFVIVIVVGSDQEEMSPEAV